jgi:hypothetical protein
MRSKIISETIRDTLNETKIKMIAGPRVRPDDPDSLMSHYQSMDDDEFFKYLYKVFYEVMDDYTSSYKIEDKWNKPHEIYISATNTVEDEGLEETVGIEFDKKTGALTLSYYGSVYVSERPATRYDPPEPITHEYEGHIAAFSTENLVTNLQNSLEKLRNGLLNDYLYTRDDYLADRADDARKSGQDWY